MALNVVQDYIVAEVSSGTSISLVFGSAPTVGNLVVVTVVTGSAASGHTVKDATPNTYTATTSSPFGGEVGIWYWVATGTPNKTINVTWTNATFGTAWAAELSNNTSSPFENDATASATNAHMVTPSYTSTNDGDYYISCINVGASLSSVDSPWSAPAVGQGTHGNGMEYYQQTTHGAQAVGYTLSGSASNSAIVAVFKSLTGKPPISADLPPFAARLSSESRTWFTPGPVSHGSKQVVGQFADLPPPAVRLSGEARTWVTPGYVAHGAKQAVGQFADLPPPRGRGSAIDTYTTNIYGFFCSPFWNNVPWDFTLWDRCGLLPAYQLPAELPPPKRSSAAIDLFTWFTPGQTAAAQIARRQTDSELPPPAVRLSGEARTWVVQGPVTQGAVAGYPFAELPPPAVRLSGEARTWVVQGPVTHGAVAAGQLPADLPPRFARAAIEWIAPGYVTQGAPAGQPNAELPPLRLRSPGDVGTWVVTGSVTAALVAPIFYDTSLPPARAVRTVELLTAFQAGYVTQGAPAGLPNAELPPPRLRPLVELTWFVPGQFGAVAGYPNAELPPRGRGPAIDYGTWFQSGYVTQGARAQTQNDSDLPLRRIVQPIDLTWFIAGSTPVTAATFYQTDTSLPPMRVRLNVENLTSYNFGGQPVTTGSAPPHTHMYSLFAGSLLSF